MHLFGHELALGGVGVKDLSRDKHRGWGVPAPTFRGEAVDEERGRGGGDILVQRRERAVRRCRIVVAFC